MILKLVTVLVAVLFCVIIASIFQKLTHKKTRKAKSSKAFDAVHARLRYEVARRRVKGY